MNTKKEIIIKATKLKKSFRTGDTEQTIFENLDLNIYKGDFTVIMGSSGAGKSTLMYSLSGMDRPTSGEVVCDGKTITSLNDDELAVFRRKNCGFVFQQIYLMDKMSLMDSEGQSIIMVTHDKKTALSGNRVLYVKDGKVYGECDLGIYTKDNANREAKLNTYGQTKLKCYRQIY